MKQKLLPAEIYKEIKANTPADMETRVLTVLEKHKNDLYPVNRRILVEEVFNVHLPADIDMSNLSADRMIRRAIDRLVDAGYLIIGSTGDGGYKYISTDRKIQDTDAVAVYRVICENQQKIDSLDTKNNKLRSILAKQYNGTIPIIEVLESCQS